MTQSLPDHQQGNPASPDAGARASTIRVALLLCAALIALWSTQILDAGFYHDDAVTSDYSSFCVLNNHTVGSFVTSEFRSMMQFQGRCSPAYCFGIVSFFVWIGDNLSLYRMWHLSWTVLALASFSWFVKRATGDWLGAIFAIAVSLAFFCTSSYHSTLVSYGVLQHTAAFGFLGLGLAYVAFENFPQRRWAFVASVISIALAVLTTEFGLVFVLLAVLVCGLQNRPRYALWRAAPYVAFAFAYAAITILAKHPGQYEGAAFGTMQPSLIATTWLKQLSGTLPFTFPFTEDGRVTLGENSVRRVILSPSFWMFFAFSVLAYHWLIRRLPIQTARNCLLLGLVGSVLIFVSAGFTAISAKYQAMLSYGVPYVQVFLQYMGLALLFAGVWQVLLRTVLTNTRWLVVAQLTLAAVLAFTYASTLALNRLTVQHLNRLWEFPRRNLGDALALLELKQAETPLFVIDRRWLQRWEWAPFAFRHSGHRGEFITLPDFIKKNAENSPEQPAMDAYFVRYPARSDRDADVYIARIATLTRTPGGVELQFTPEGARVMRFGPDLESVTGSGRVCEAAAGLADTTLPLITKEIRPGRVATVWRASAHSLHVP